MEKAREFQKNISFYFIDYTLVINNKAFACVDHNKVCKILQEMGISDNLICLLRNLYAGHEATVKTGLGTADLFQIGKGGHHPVEYIMRNAGLDESTSWNQDCWEKYQ